MKLEITFGRDSDGDYSIDLKLTIGRRAWILGAFAMYIPELAEPLGNRAAREMNIMSVPPFGKPTFFFRNYSGGPR
jgi:hypothetical protein